jgi:hypothetical protein
LYTVLGERERECSVSGMEVVSQWNVMLAVLLRTRGLQSSGETVNPSIYVGPSNREISEHAGVNDQGQISKLMPARLEEHGLVENTCSMNTTSPRKGTRMSKALDRLTSLLPKTGLFAMLCGFLRVKGTGASKISRWMVLSIGSIGALVIPVSAAQAYATIEGPPKFSAAPGLPDGRVYEQVIRRIRTATRRVLNK